MADPGEIRREARNTPAISWQPTLFVISPELLLLYPRFSRVDFARIRLHDPISITHSHKSRIIGSVDANIRITKHFANTFKKH